MPGLSVIFSTFNGAATLPRMLDALEELEAPPGGWKLLAVDNASTDESGRLLREREARLPLTALFEPRPGKNRALNAALGLAEGDLVVLTDDDVVPPRDWLVSLSHLADQRAEYDIFGGAVRPLWPSPPPDWLLRLVPKGHFAWTDFPEGPLGPLDIWGPNMAVRRHVFERLRFDETFGPDGTDEFASGSETEFTLRAVEAGRLCWHAPEIVIGHIVRAHQLTPEWVLQRFYHHARGERRLEGRRGDAALFGRRPSGPLGVAGATAQVALASLAGGFEARFAARRRLNELRGDIAEFRSRQQATKPTPGRAELSRFLVKAGTQRCRHYVGTLHDHLMRTFDLLDARGLQREVCLGAGLHSIYGTNLLDHASLPYDRRTRVKQAFCARVEVLAYLFSILERPATLDTPVRLDADEVVVETRTGGKITLPRPTFDDLRWMECANLADQGSLSQHPTLERLWAER